VLLFPFGRRERWMLHHAMGVCPADEFCSLTPPLPSIERGLIRGAKPILSISDENRLHGCRHSGKRDECAHGGNLPVIFTRHPATWWNLSGGKENPGWGVEGLRTNLWCDSSRGKLRRRDRRHGDFLFPSKKLTVRATEAVHHNDQALAGKKLRRCAITVAARNTCTISPVTISVQ